MELGADLSAEAVAEALPGRPIRAYRAVLSTEADALAWAREGAPSGAVVVAAYQAAPRGRAGLPWEVSPDGAMAFSIVLRPGLADEREGWLYTLAATGLADALGDDCTIEWPDEVDRGGSRLGAVGVQSDLGPGRVNWAVVSVLVIDAAPPRAALVGRVVKAIEARCRAPSGDVLADYMARCRTLGRSLCARLIPLGPGGPEVSGRAVAALKDGALVFETAKGNRVAVRPQNLGLLEEPPSDDTSPEMRSSSG